VKTDGARLVILLGMTERSGFCVHACRPGLFAGLLLVCPVKGAEEPPVLPVWPGAVPGDYGTIGPSSSVPNIVPSARSPMLASADWICRRWAGCFSVLV